MYVYMISVYTMIFNDNYVKDTQVTKHTVLCILLSEYVIQSNQILYWLISDIFKIMTSRNNLVLLSPFDPLSERNSISQ